MPERQTTLSCTEGTAKEPAAGIKHSYKAESAGWLCRRGKPGILCSCSLLSLFLPFIICNFKPRRGAGIPRGAKDILHILHPLLPSGPSPGVSSRCHTEAHLRTGMAQQGELLSDKAALDQLFCAIFCLPAGTLLKVQRTGNPALFRQDLTAVKPSLDLSPGTV